MTKFSNVFSNKSSLISRIAAYIAVVLLGAILPFGAIAPATAAGSISATWAPVASSSDGTKLAAGDYFGDIWTSTDSGVNWVDRTSSLGSKSWKAIASSSNGTKLAAVVYNGGLYTSADSGATWTDRTSAAGTRDWASIVSSSDGTKIYATAHTGTLMVSTDSGATWTSRASSDMSTRVLNNVTVSTDGQKLAVASDNGIFLSSDAGITWTWAHANATNQPGTYYYYGITSSGDGSVIAAGIYGDYVPFQVAVSTDSGATWTRRTVGSGVNRIISIAASSDGSKLVTGQYMNGAIWTSSDTGATWTNRNTGDFPSGLSYWRVTSSSDGSKLLAAGEQGCLMTSSDSGVSWANRCNAPVAPSSTGRPVATAGNASATLTWTKPSSGTPTITYTITASPNDGSCTVTGRTASCTGLTNGQAYTFTVTATNSTGSSTSAASNSVTPSATVAPSAPGKPVATPGNATVSLSWTASVDGTAPITYTVTSSPAGATCVVTDLTAACTGLTNGTAYTFVVTATNVAGSANSASSDPVTPAIAPNAPGKPVATPGNTTASLVWTASTAGTAPITYTVSSSPAGASCVVTALTAACTGLTNGTSYTFVITATNVAGSANSASSDPVTPALAPNAPGKPVATPGNATASLSWAASSVGTSPITYTVTSSPAGASCVVTALTATCSGLTNGTAYTFIVTATNVAGSADSVSSDAVTPAIAPSAPGKPAAAAGDKRVKLTWTASTDGTAPITYTVTSSPAGANCVVTNLTAACTGLVNGRAYTFVITATNVAGSADSVSSDSVTPKAPDATNILASLQTTCAPVMTKITGTGTFFMPFDRIQIGNLAFIKKQFKQDASHFEISIPTMLITGQSLSAFSYAGNVVGLLSDCRTFTPNSVSTKVLFAGDSSTLSAAAKLILSNFVKAKELKAKQLISISAVGYTQYVAGTTNDAALSAARAKAVIKYLASLGIKSSWAAKGAGVATTQTSLSRRVVLTVTWH